MREPRKPLKNDAPSASDKSPSPPGCHNCIHAVWDPTDTMQALGTGWPVRPRCSNHPDTPGQLRKVPGRGPCRNWRRKPDPLLRLDPGEQTDPHECRITLTKGLFAVVDPQDYEWLNGFRWHATTSRGQDLRRDGDQRQIDLDAPPDHESAAGQVGGPQEQGPPEQPPVQSALRHAGPEPPQQRLLRPQRQAEILAIRRRHASRRQVEGRRSRTRARSTSSATSTTRSKRLWPGTPRRRNCEASSPT